MMAQQRLYLNCFFVCIEFRRRIVAKEVEFEDLARTESHCSSAQRGGDLGFFGHGQMQSK